MAIFGRRLGPRSKFLGGVLGGVLGALFSALVGRTSARFWGAFLGRVSGARFWGAFSGFVANVLCVEARRVCSLFCMSPLLLCGTHGASAERE